MMIKTDAEKKARQDGTGLAMCFIDGPKFANEPQFVSETLEQKYNQGVTRENVIVAHYFGLVCADLLAMRSEKEIQQKAPKLIKLLSKFNDNEFSFGLECFKNRMKMWNPFYSERPTHFDKLIKESVANTELEHHPAIQSLMLDNKDKVINNISTLRDSVIATNENKLKNT